MITFLPYPDFTHCAMCLDVKRLGQQRREAKGLLETLLADKMKNHPLMIMWRGYENELIWYGISICREWQIRGYKDTLLDYFLSKKKKAFRDPHWLGVEKLHSSHRRRLITKNPNWYSQFDWPETPDPTCEYWWPE
jgi:hypothetical protein